MQKMVKFPFSISLVSGSRKWTARFALVFGALLLGACGDIGRPSRGPEVEVTFRVGSALGEFCQRAAAQFNQQSVQLETGETIALSCEAQGSGDVVETVISLAQQFRSGSLSADTSDLPTLISVDGEIYHSQLIYRMDQLFPGQNYIPSIVDAPLLANSPMVFMTPSDLAPGLRQVDDLFKSLVTAETHKDLDAVSPNQKIYYVHTAPSRSNSGLQTLAAQFASVAGKRPEDLVSGDITRYQTQIQQIQDKITRYGASTSSLAKAMLENGPYWASIGSVYESSVIAANTNLPPGQTRYEAVYPKATFTSNMRGILLQAPWVSGQEKSAAEQILIYLQSPEAQQIAADLGLRPGAPGATLGPKFSPEFGVDPQASYDSYRPPAPEVATAMIRSWEEVTKKSSLVVVVVDSSGSMQGNKLPAVQNTLKTYVNSLGPKDQIALVDFDSAIRDPIRADGTPEGRDRGLQFIGSLQADGGTRLYDAALTARNWLLKNLRPEAINAVLILTDGEDSESNITLEELAQELQKSGFSSDQRIAFFTVGYGDEGEFNPQSLEQIASLNGGYYRKGDPSTIAQLMADLQLEF
ncbi:MAG: VWA domain-containing protein [Leptolyngbyaceae cyanobacterium MO_188.B28]|nr:VWA domain-containing protein [Leptolyngbyaceae cyanobacterium MO_188.B28]